jgi:hypothetical protein
MTFGLVLLHEIHEIEVAAPHVIHVPGHRHEPRFFELIAQQFDKIVIAVQDRHDRRPVRLL